MNELLNGSNNSSSNPATLAAELLYHYNFEPTSCTFEQQIAAWLDHYPAQWLLSAIIEALYQGRYKTVSVEQILVIWQRRQHPVCHFNHEFERLIRGSLFRSPDSSSAELSTKLIGATPKPALSYRKMLLELPAVRAASRLERLNEIPSLKLALMRSGLDSRMATIEATAPTTNGLTSFTSESDLLDNAPIATVSNDLKPTEKKFQPACASTSTLSDREFKEFKEGVVFGLSYGLAVRILAPRFRLELSRYYNPDWMKFLHNAPIDQFTPATTPHEFHSKLRSVVEPRS